MKKIITLLAVLLIVGCTNNKTKTTEEEKEIILTNNEIVNVIDGAKMWAKKNKNIMPDKTNNEVCIPIEKLFKEKYIVLENYKSYKNVKVNGSIFINYNPKLNSYEYDYSPDKC